MVAKKKRIFTDMDARMFLSAIGACRVACIDVHRRAAPTTEVYRRASVLLETIDDVAELLTGDRQHFWLKPHSNATFK
jgi:hypothetical protein